MSESLFQAPPIEQMNQLLPAFDFISILAVTSDQAIYVATQKSLDRHVAIKIHAPHLTHDAEFREAFESMARQMAKLNHVNLLGVFNSGVVDGMLYLIMEHVPGRKLSSWAGGKALDLPQAVSIMCGICAGLAHAHANEVLHGGLSMANILLNPQLEPKIDNFGFVDSVSPDGHDPSSRFIAPEIWDPQIGLCVQSDIYSLGAIFYELVTGQPHAADAKPAHQLVAVKETVSALCNKATAADPAQRHQTVNEFLEDIEKLGSKPRAAASGFGAKGKGKSNLAVGAPRAAGGASPVLMKSASGWKLGTHLVVIAILLYAIHIAWTRYQNEQEKRDKIIQQQEREYELKLQQAKALDLERRRERERARKEAEERRLRELANQQQQQQQQQPEKQPEKQVIQKRPQAEEVLESLMRLRKGLLAGECEEMPAGAKSIGGGVYLLMPKAMTWPQAASFAEEFGAHLMIPDATATLQWLRGELLAGSDQTVWIGAASNGRDTWALANGTPFVPVQQPEREGHYLAVNWDGKLVAYDANVEHPFILEWRKDGSRPGQLADLLKKTAQSLGGASPVYPPGTYAFGLRHYLLVSREVDWATADAMAKLGGGHLMVVRGVAENYNLRRMVGEMAAKDGIWMGALHKQGVWTWITGEQWDKKMDWINPKAQALDGMGLLLRPGRGYEGADASRNASSFIIEWSRDAASGR